MKKKKLIILTVLLLAPILIAGCTKKTNSKKNASENVDSKNFRKEYQEVSKNNPFVYKDVDEIIKIMKNGTGVVYLGYPECPWCQAYVKYLNEVAKEVGIEKIYYCNTKKVKETSMDKYHYLINLLDGYLQYNDEGEQWIYVPNVSFHVEGKIIGNDYETSKDTHNLKEPKEYWTEEEVTDLKKKLKKYMKEIKEKSNICTDCNK